MIKSKIRIVIITLAIVLFLVLVGVLVNNIITYNKLQSDRKDCLEEIEKLKNDYEKLKNTQDYLDNAQYIEKRARELGLIKDGDTIWTIIGKEDPSKK